MEIVNKFKYFDELFDEYVYYARTKDNEIVSISEQDYNESQR